jgi:hypothetical protein
MRFVIALFLTLLAGATALADAKFYAEAGASHFALRGARFGSSPLERFGGQLLTASSRQSRTAPLVAAGCSFGDFYGLRLSYQFIDDLSGTVEYGAPSGTVPRTAVYTRGYFRDEVHLLGIAPELKLPVNRIIKLTFSPTLNWVASRGEINHVYVDVVSIAPLEPFPTRKQRKEAFTFGGSMGLTWSVAKHAALSVAYHYADLDPSFERTAHIVSGGLRWNF